jgi:S-adenosylmethionine decarboxylase
VTGIEWVVDAHGCSPAALADVGTFRALFACIMSDLDLHPCGEAQWTTFAGAGGVTGFQVLAESHLACHSFPEHGTLCLNLFCCRPRPDWDFTRHLGAHLGAHTVNVRRLERALSPNPPPDALTASTTGTAVRE